jgi:hypothetical protein
VLPLSTDTCHVNEFMAKGEAESECVDHYAVEQTVMN